MPQVISPWGSTTTLPHVVIGHWSRRAIFMEGANPFCRFDCECEYCVYGDDCPMSIKDEKEEENDETR